jgi:hypothetical protein
VSHRSHDQDAARSIIHGPGADLDGGRPELSPLIKAERRYRFLDGNDDEAITPT